MSTVKELVSRGFRLRVSGFGLNQAERWERKVPVDDTSTINWVESLRKIEGVRVSWYNYDGCTEEIAYIQLR